jgi:acetyl esterase
MKRVLWAAVGVLLCLLVGGVAAALLSPWPGAMAIRWLFDRGAEAASEALLPHVPPGVTQTLGEVYDPADPDARLDVFLPPGAQSAAAALPVVVWVHGGGWVSGHRGDIGNYAQVLAGRGFAVVSVDYSIAPEKIYPAPLRQVNAALKHLQTQAGRLRIDAQRIVLAGDSAGAHIVAQVANLTTSPAYAGRLGIVPALKPAALRGLLLFCGPYDVRKVNLDGPFGVFLRTVLWSYSGSRDFMANPLFATASVIDHVTPAFPPAFISAGNADPLLPQSRAMADKLASLGVAVDTLFFADDHQPPLGHEYQFGLDTEAGRQALERATAFLQARFAGS